MRHFVQKFLLFTVIFWGLSKANAQSTLHLIISSDNINQDISAGCQKDFDKTAEFFKGIANEARMSFKFHSFRFNRNEAYSFFENFQCQSDDAVVFLYTGHGFSKEDDKVIWPFMYYCQHQNSSTLTSCGVPLDWVHQALIGKNPRMSITLGNSCNILPGQEEGIEHQGGLTDKEDVDESNPTVAHNLELLTQYQGHILVSGASRGQFAYTNDEDGSYFVNALVSVLGNGLTNDQHSTTWASMLKEVSRQVQKQKKDQRPQYLIVQNEKKMYSEGMGKYQNQASFELLNLDVPGTGAQNYDNWEVDEFDAEDYSQDWEKEFEKEFLQEMALEDLPTILLYALYIDDNNISQNEYQKAYQFYNNLIGSYGLAIDPEQDIFLESANEAASDMSNPAWRAELLQVFKIDLDTKARSGSLDLLPKISDNPNSNAFQSFLKELR